MSKMSVESIKQTWQPKCLKCQPSLATKKSNKPGNPKCHLSLATKMSKMSNQSFNQIVKQTWQPKTQEVCPV